MRGGHDDRSGALALPGHSQRAGRLVIAERATHRASNLARMLMRERVHLDSKVTRGPGFPDKDRGFAVPVDGHMGHTSGSRPTGCHGPTGGPVGCRPISPAGFTASTPRLRGSPCLGPARLDRLQGQALEVGTPCRLGASRALGWVEGAVRVNLAVELGPQASTSTGEGTVGVEGVLSGPAGIRRNLGGELPVRHEELQEGRWFPISRLADRPRLPAGHPALPDTVDVATQRCAIATQQIAKPVVLQRIPSTRVSN